MQAVATKELRSRMRGARAFAVLSVYLLLLSCLVIALYWFIRETVASDPFNTAPVPVGRILFYGVTLVELLLIAPLAPAFGANSIAGERERQTFDLVMTTPISARSFVLGKLFSNLSYILLLVFVSLPVQVLALLFGGLSLTEVLLGFWMLIVAVIFYASASIFFSSVLKTTTTASIFSYLTVAMTLIGALLLFLMSGFLLSFAGMGGGAPFPFLFSEDGIPTRTAVYLGTFLTSLSPITAGAATAAAVITGQGLFWFRWDVGGGFGQPTNYLIINPWVVYSLIYLGLSALLIWLSVRRVRPTRARNAARPARPAELVQQEAAS